MNSGTHRSPFAAWKHLCEHGGVELDGRDEGLDRKILLRLNPVAESLEDALEQATMEAFTTAFFEAIHPFVAMFRDILDFFESATITEGPEQWVLAVGDVDLDLEHFRKWIEAWQEAGKARKAIPAIDWRGGWALWEILEKNKQIRSELNKTFGSRGAASLSLPDDVRAWVVAYDDGEYRDLPVSLAPDYVAEQLSQCALTAQAVLQLLQDQAMTPGLLKKNYIGHLHRQGTLDRSDWYSFWTIAQNETDHWLRSFLVALSAANTHVSASEFESLGQDLSKITDRYPKRPFDINVSLSDLESVLSLPIWKKRYELYSVWIATELVRALEGHEIELHNEEGRIVFGFHKTKVATVHSSPGPFVLFSERRSSLENPRGEGRTASVQPDHSFWTTEMGKDVCRLVVEVKHYKKSAKGKFAAALEDYARAHPHGEIYLACHGPTGNALSEVSREVSGRCHTIEHLTSSAVEEREKLAEAVRNVVGEPVVVLRKGPERAGPGGVLVLDVSVSMVGRLRSGELLVLVQRIVDLESVSEIVAVDTANRGSRAPTRTAIEELTALGGGCTALRDPVQTLLDRGERVVVLTDQDGERSMADIGTTVHPHQQYAPVGVMVRVCGEGHQEGKNHGSRTH